MGWAEFQNIGEIDDLKQVAVKRIDAHPEIFSLLLDLEPSRFLEVGCGTGGMSYALSKLSGAEGVALDKNKEIIERLSSINDHDKLVFQQGDCKSLPAEWDEHFDLVFHQGLFEHFNNQDIKAMTKECLRVADKMIFSVPSFYYPRKDYGNERLMKKEQWFNILSDYSTSGFYYGELSHRLISSIREFQWRYWARFVQGFERPQLCIEVEK